MNSSPQSNRFSPHRRRGRLAAIAFTVALLAPLPLMADTPMVSDAPVAPAAGFLSRSQLYKQVGIDQHLNQPIPLNLRFRDERGHLVRLSQYFGLRPVVLVPAYFRCPMLCTQVLHAVARGFSEVPLQLGKDYSILTVSFDPGDTPTGAEQEKDEITPRYTRTGARAGWHFLTGDQQDISALMKAIGFRYLYFPKTGQFAHPSGIVLLTPHGRISQYYYGVDFKSRDLRLGLVQSAHEKIGTFEDAVLLLCYHYDPRTGKYGTIVFNATRIGGAVILIGLGALLISMWRLERRRARELARTVPELHT